MRVLQLGKYWRQDGGIETHVKNLCKGLAGLGIEVVNLVSSLDRSKSEFHVDGYRVVEVPTLGIVASTSISPAMVLAARRLHAERPFDIVHMHFPDPMGHLVSMALPASIPRVITWHSDIIRQQRLLRLYRPWQQREIRRASAIVAATGAHFATSGQIPLDYPAEQRHVIPFGMDYSWLERTPEIDRKAASIRARAQGRFIAFALGRHVSYKGFDVLLDAMTHTDAFLVLGGEGPLSDNLRAQAARLGVDSRIWFTGRLPQDQVAACYHACDVFCLPSVTQAEALGLVQLEAMYCGKPVICTQLGNGVNLANPHRVTGLTVEPHDAGALAGAIDSLKSDDALRKTLAFNAQAHARDNFSLAATCERHLQTYRTLLARNGGQPLT